MSELENNLRLNEKEQENIKRLYAKYEKNCQNDCFSSLEKERNDALTQWGQYSEKIKNKTLKLDEYTSIKGEYLCDFLERRSGAFGGIKPGNANRFMVKKNDENAKDDNGNLKFSPNSYTIIDKEKKINVNATEKEANEQYEWILSLINRLVCAENFDEIIKLEKNDDDYKRYQSNQILRKIVVLQNPYNGNNPLGFFYQDDAVNKLMTIFYKKDYGNDYSFLEKSKAIMMAMARILGKDLNEVEKKDFHLMSKFAWKLAALDNYTSEKNPNVIFYGPPGTGKTYTIETSIQFICLGDERRYRKVQFHPTYSYEDFIEGVKPTGIVDNGIRLELMNGVFKSFCKEALKDLDHTYYFVADEINRANLSSVFGETLSLLEADYRDYANDERHLIDTPYSELEKNFENDKKEKVCYDLTEPGKFGIPKNIRFIGMMNDVDKSIDTFDLALRRRFKWVRMDCDYNVIEKVCGKYKNVDEYCASCRDLNTYISKDLSLGNSYQFGHSNFLKINSICAESEIKDYHKKELFNSFLLPTLSEYLRSFYSDEKVLDEKVEGARKKFVGDKGVSK